MRHAYSEEPDFPPNNVDKKVLSEIKEKPHSILLFNATCNNI